MRISDWSSDVLSSELAGEGGEAAILGGDALEEPQRGGADGDDAASRGAGGIHGRRGLGAYLARLAMHGVSLDLFGLHGPEGAGADVQRHVHPVDAALGKTLQQAVGEVKRSEEHTSELQSLMRISYAVFCLKKKRKYNGNDYIYVPHNHSSIALA